MNTACYIKSSYKRKPQSLLKITEGHYFIFALCNWYFMFCSSRAIVLTTDTTLLFASNKFLGTWQFPAKIIFNSNRLDHARPAAQPPTFPPKFYCSPARQDVSRTHFYFRGGPLDFWGGKVGWSGIGMIDFLTLSSTWIFFFSWRMLDDIFLSCKMLFFPLIERETERDFFHSTVVVCMTLLCTSMLAEYLSQNLPTHP